MLESFKQWLLILLKTGPIAIGGLVGIVVVGTLLNLASYRNKLGPVILPIPSAEIIGREYLQAVTQENRNYIAEDEKCVQGQLLQDIAKYGGTEVRNVSVVTEWHSGNN
ncbi:hypothetical protein [Fischerella thermalis]|uniref:Uncharacterized protein n=1 Tax=Fischerella thermalis CCMEE 5318 TaxID=2019666 RepID=A0A2N6L757_9CYAN|nr:hypothetical protein [Fischerella thermalis]PMB17776.1 hypothetical protein CEN46_22725 [Fischerella thermalis CCMEE 5318]